MGLIEELLGCPLQRLTRSFWAAKLNTGEWVSEARTVHDWRKGEQRQIDWMDDIVATGDCNKIVELWLFCPPSQTSPLGNTARLPITRPGSAFQFKIATHDSPIVGPGRRTLQAHIVGRVDDAKGNCTCFIYDPVQDGLLTPETPIYTPLQGERRYAGKTNVNSFHSWRPSLAPLGQLALDRIGVTL
jgi:hypothetical protein